MKVIHDRQEWWADRHGRLYRVEHDMFVSFEKKYGTIQLPGKKTTLVTDGESTITRTAAHGTCATLFTPVVQGGGYRRMEAT